LHRYLVALIWPAGMALIVAVGLAAISRTPRGDAAASLLASGHRRMAWGSRSGLAGAITDSARLVTIAALGSLVVFCLTCALGVLVVNHGLVIDRPVFHWMQAHQVPALAALMDRLTKIGDTWTTWGAAAAAAVCLAVTWRSRRWLPPVALGFMIFSDHYTTLALRHVFHRLGPPTSPLGTYPSGGDDRVILFYGLIAYLLWREFSGEREMGIAAGTAVAALGFNEAYSRVYLSLHWFTDAVSGLLYGFLLLVAFILAVRLVAGPPAVPKAARGVPDQHDQLVDGRPAGTGPQR
jgi:hypothetical protein